MNNGAEGSRLRQHEKELRQLIRLMGETLDAYDATRGESKEVRDDWGAKVFEAARAVRAQAEGSKSR